MELDVPNPEHSGMRRPEAHVRADWTESLQPGTIGGNSRPHIEHCDECGVGGLQGST